MARSPAKTTPARGRSRSRKPVSHAEPETSKAGASAASRVAYKPRESPSMHMDQATRSGLALRNVKTFSCVSLAALAIYLAIRCPPVHVAQIVAFPLISKEAAPFGVAHQKLFRRTDLGFILTAFVAASALGDGFVAFYGWYDFACFQSVFSAKKRNWVGAISCTISSFFLTLLLCNLVGVYDMHHQFLSASLIAMSVLVMHIYDFYHDVKSTEESKKLLCWLNTCRYATQILGLSTPACYMMTAHKVMPLWIWVVNLTIAVCVASFDCISCSYHHKKYDYSRKEMYATYVNLIMSTIVGFAVLIGTSR